MKNNLFIFVNQQHEELSKQPLEIESDSKLLISSIKDLNNSGRNEHKHHVIEQTKRIKKMLAWIISIFSIILFIGAFIFMHYSKESLINQQQELNFKQTENEVVVAKPELEEKQSKKENSFIIQNGSHANYRLFLKMMNETNFLVEANIEVENRSKSNWMDLQFYFLPNMFDEAKIKEIKINGEKVKYYLNDDSLKVMLYHSLNPGKSLNVYVSYTLTPSEDGLRLFRSDKSIALAEWYPMLATYLNEWKKDPYYPGVESFFTGYSNFVIQYELLDGYTLTSSAEDDGPVNTATGSIEAKKIKEFYISLTKDPLIKTKKVNQTEIRVIGSKQNEQNINKILDTASEALEFFDSRIGEYPYKQLDIVYGHNFNIEYPGIVTVSDQGEIEFQVHATIHEVAHQWFYGLVSNNTYNDGWLDEGLTELSTDLFLLVHDKRSLEESFGWVNWLFNERDPHPSNLPLHDYRHIGGAAAYLYAQPVIKLWEVMQAEDPSGMKALEFLSDYFNTYSYQIVNTEEFIRFMKLYYDVDQSYFAEWLRITPDYITWKL